MADAPRPKVVSVRTRDAIIIGGSERTHIAVDSPWAVQGKLGLEIEREGGMAVWVRWNERKPGPVRCKSLVSCTQINFEPTAA